MKKQLNDIIFIFRRSDSFHIDIDILRLIVTNDFFVFHIWSILFENNHALYLFYDSQGFGDV